MNLKNYYWYFQKALSEDFCNKIIEEGFKKKQELGSVVNKEHEQEKSKKLRNSNIVWLNNKWIYKKIHPYVNTANVNANWNFEWDWSESAQFTIYNKNQHYDWHCDTFDTPYDCPNNLNTHNKIRKLSVTISLSDPKDYEGGELEFDFRNSRNGKPVLKKCTEVLPRGSLVVFPSFIYHRVRPVTKGTRLSLVIWNLGYPFK
jgi:PKHD-type hydroxylase